MTGLTISRLRLDDAAGDAIVEDVSIALRPGEIVGLIGESASGKTTVGLAALAHLHVGVVVADGSVRLGDASLLDMDDTGLRQVRGARVSYLSQHPASALNPARRIGRQLLDVLAAHDDDRATRPDRVRAALAAVSLPVDASFLDRYPHQLSGGQLQRVALAVALVCEPEVLVLDEPTTGLDTATAAQITGVVRELCARRQLCVLWITHDLGVVAGVCDRISVMYAGSLVEEGPTAAVMADPAHPYTRHLLAAAPDPAGRRAMVGLDGRVPETGHRPDGCRFAPRCDLVNAACTSRLPALDEVRTNRWARCVVPFTVPHALRASEQPAHPQRAGGGGAGLELRNLSATYRGVEAVRDVSIRIATGEWLALVGPSGAGKTTVIRAIAGLHAEHTGGITLDGTPLAASVRRRTDAQRRAIRLVSQYPGESFNPRRTVGDSIDRPSLIQGATAGDARRATHALLDQVALDSRLATRYPRQLSGGELQRAAIARALVGGPRVLLCDEITSSLDTVVQAALVELIADLHRRSDMTVVFVSHDLALVAAVADRTAVITDGTLAAG